jgi:hypothetical protein
VKRVLVAMAMSFVACSNDLPSSASVSGVRVLAVQLDTPFARPGQTVSMTMLVHDGGAPLAGPRPLSIAWLGGCDDPSDGAPGACYERFSWFRSVDVGTLATKSVPSDLPPSASLGYGTSFTVTVPPDVIEKRWALPDETVPRGLSYAFFAACAGDLVAATEARPAAGIPVGCVDRATGARVGAERLVTGYVAIRSYESASNHNPVLGRTSIDGRVASAQSCAMGEACPEGEACTSSGTCRLVLARCTASDVADCPEHSVLPAVDASSVEVDDTATPSGTTETLWAAYYTTSGDFRAPTRVVSQPTLDAASLGSYDGALRLGPGFTGEARIWAVVHDDRGGVAWTSDDVVIR